MRRVSLHALWACVPLSCGTVLTAHGTVDRIEGRYAVVECPDGASFIHIPTSQLRPGLREGDRVPAHRLRRRAAVDRCPAADPAVRRSDP